MTGRPTPAANTAACGTPTSRFRPTTAPDPLEGPAMPRPILTILDDVERLADLPPAMYQACCTAGEPRVAVS